MEEKKDTRAPKGIAHSFKGRSPCSRRTAYWAKHINDAVKSYMAQNNDDLRSGLKDVVFVDHDKQRRFRSAYLDGKNDKKVFFSAKSERGDERELEKGGYWVSLFDNDAVNLIDTRDGLIHFDRESGDPVFVLIKRSESIECKKPDVFIKALERIEKTKGSNSNVRGGKREIVYEKGTEDANYVTTGIAANRGGPGLYRKDIPEDTKVNIKKMGRYISQKCGRYIHKRVKKQFVTMMKKFGIDEEAVETLREREVAENDKEDGEIVERPMKRRKINYFPAMATGRNTCLQMHMDEDCFFSVVVLYRMKDIKREEYKNKKHERNRKKRKTVMKSVIENDSEILKYFTFSTGVSIGLRTGDILMFNPLIEHCVSSNTDACKDDDVYSTSHYFKSTVLGLNDNKLQFDE